jgi:hypothetical protein
MGSLLGRLEDHHAAARDKVAHLHDRIAELTAELAAAQDALTRLQITKDTLTALDETDDGADGAAARRDPVLDSTAYRQILAVLETSDTPQRARDLCAALGLSGQPKHVEGVRAKLKRLVSRGVATEPEPGLFVLKQHQQP